jgi:hypothetical protein
MGITTKQSAVTLLSTRFTTENYKKKQQKESKEATRKGFETKNVDTDKWDAYCSIINAKLGRISASDDRTEEWDAIQKVFSRPANIALLKTVIGARKRPVMATKYDTPIRILCKLSHNKSPLCYLSKQARKNITKALEPNESLLINPVTGQYIYSILSRMAYKRTKLIYGKLKKKAALQQQAYDANPAANARLMIQISLARSRQSI